MAINGVLPLKVARCDAILTWNILGSNTIDLISLHSVCGTALFHWYRNHRERLRRVGKIMVLLFLRIVCRVEKRPKNVVLAPFVSGEPQNFSHAFANLVHFLTGCEIRLTSWWSPFAKPGNESADSIYGGYSKNDGPILSRLWTTKVHELLGDCREALVVSITLPGLSITCFIQKIFASKFSKL